MTLYLRKDTIMIKNRWKSMPSTILLTLFLASSAAAAQVEMSSSLNPVGSGARATGMGGAFIGVADDATAASWNPAGLIQLEKPEVSIVYATFGWKQDYHPSTHPEINTSNSVDTSGINYASYAYPFKALDRNMVFSINYQRLYEMDKNTAFNYRWDLGGADYLNDSVSYVQKGYLYALSPAIAVQVRPELSFGLTLNIWGNTLGQNGWESSYRSSGTGQVLGNSLSKSLVWTTNNDFEGINANLGVLWSITDAVSLGAVYKTPFDGKVKQGTYFYQQQTLGTTTSISPPVESSTSFTMKMPASYGLGMQYRRSDSLVFALDVYQTQWSDFMIVDAAGNQTNPLSTKPISQGALKDTTQMRFGGEYLFIKTAGTTAVRAGLFSDPEPGTGTVNKFTGFSLGTGYSTKQYSLDASYQYRSGKNVDGDIASIQPGSTDVTQQTIMLSGIWYF